MLAIVVLLGAVALVASLVRHRAVPAEAEPSASASTSAAPVPTTAPAGPWRVVRVGDRVTMATSFTDPGTNDTHRCDFAWDDGTTTSGPAQGDACRATHAYPAAGMYTVTSTVTDDDGGVGRAPGVLVVVYDPVAGPVRGSGRLGPGGAGAFDFVAGYPRRSATGPDEVGFVLYGYRPDRLRIVVWDGAAPEAEPVRYDSRPGTSFDLDAADPAPVEAGTIAA